MPTGLKQTSSVVSIGFNATELAPNAFQQTTVDLNLSPLDREVFVVLAINLEPYSPDSVAGVSTGVKSSLTTTSQTAVAQLSESNCLATAIYEIRQNATSTDGAPFQTVGLETPPATLEYIGIIATNDFFVQVEGFGNTSARQLNGKLYGYRATASADIFAALVQSEVLSA
jgi:hypothetical protein